MTFITKKKLGEILLEEKLITEEQLAKALSEQGSGKLKLGQHLIRRGIISEDQIVDCLGRQLRIRKYHPDMYTFDVKLSQLLSIDDAQKHRLAPLKREGRLLTVAMTDPMDIAAIDFIESKANCEVEVVICTEREFNQLISGLYGIQSGVGGAFGVLDIEANIVAEKEEEAVSQDVQLAYLQDMAGEAPVIRIVNSIFLQAIREGASDIHISPQQNAIQMRFRIDGKLHEVMAPSKAMFLPIVARIKILANMDITITRIPLDGRFTLRMENKEINVRVSSIPTIYGENLVLRLLDTSSGIYSLDHIGLTREDTDKIRAVISKPYGMILSTGPTGSGKSTSIYAVLNELNSPDSSIMTLEDPVEYRIQNIRQVQLNSKAGMTFASGLRSILRQDPDIIMVGEIRDGETAAIAVQAAQTGHRVLSTIHTNNAVGAITRFIDMGIEPFLLSSTLLMCIAQRLVRTICPYCREPYNPPENALVSLGVKNLEEANFQRGKGCNQCFNTGYKGRTGIFEVLVIDEIVREMITNKRPAHEITQKCIEFGTLKTLQYDAGTKALKGVTTLEEASSAVII